MTISNQTSKPEPGNNTDEKGLYKTTYSTYEQITRRFMEPTTCKNEDLTCSRDFEVDENGPNIRWNFAGAAETLGLDENDDTLKNKRESALDYRQRDCIAAEILERKVKMSRKHGKDNKRVKQYERAAIRLLGCKRNTIVMYCQQCQAKHAVPLGCRLGICPDCAAEMTRERERLYSVAMANLLTQRHLRGKGLRFAFLTLTVRHRATLAATLEYCEKSARRLHEILFRQKHQKDTREKLLALCPYENKRQHIDPEEVDAMLDYCRYLSETDRNGSLWRSEVSDAQYNHAHIHVLALCRFLPNTTTRKDGSPLTVNIPAAGKRPARTVTPTGPWLSWIWRAITKDSWVVDIRHIGRMESPDLDLDGLQSAVIECVKYPFKFPGAKKLHKLPAGQRVDLGAAYFPAAGLADIYEAFAGHRAVWTTGLMRCLIPKPGTIEYYALLASWCQSCDTGVFAMEYISEPENWLKIENDRYQEKRHDRSGGDGLKIVVDLKYIAIVKSLRTGASVEDVARAYHRAALRTDTNAELAECRTLAEVTAARLRHPANKPPDDKWSGRAGVNN
jgi:hypothetical protein